MTLHIAIWHFGIQEPRSCFLPRCQHREFSFASWMRTDFVRFARLAVRCPEILILSFISGLPCLPSYVSDFRSQCLHRVMREYALA